MAAPNFTCLPPYLSSTSYSSPLQRLDFSPKFTIPSLTRICLDILKDKWSPALQIRTVLLRLAVRRNEQLLDQIIVLHMKNAQKEAAKVLANRTKIAEVLQDEDSSDEELSVRFNNKHGASWSSAHYSDTDIVNLKAPVLKKVNGRPRGKRFVAGYESSKKMEEKQ